MSVSGPQLLPVVTELLAVMDLDVVEDDAGNNRKMTRNCDRLRVDCLLRNSY